MWNFFKAFMVMAGWYYISFYYELNLLNCIEYKQRSLYNEWKMMFPQYTVSLTPTTCNGLAYALLALLIRVTAFCVQHGYQRWYLGFRNLSKYYVYIAWLVFVHCIISLLETSPSEVCQITLEGHNIYSAQESDQLPDIDEVEDIIKRRSPIIKRINFFLVLATTLILRFLINCFMPRYRRR